LQPARYLFPPAISRRSDECPIFQVLWPQGLEIAAFGFVLMLPGRPMAHPLLSTLSMNVIASHLTIELFVC
jgi:hypothetical protein